jgi:hypothetical protein
MDMNKVFVYFNLHKKCWSLKNVKTGRVIGHRDEVFLSDCLLKVSEAGRQRVLREKRKNVHAGVQGFETNVIPIGSSVEITYNPYKYNSFVVKETGEPVKGARCVHLCKGRVWAIF